MAWEDAISKEDVSLLREAIEARVAEIEDNLSEYVLAYSEEDTRRMADKLHALQRIDAHLAELES